MYKIKTLNTISETGLNLLPHTLYEVASEIQHPDAILVRSHDMHHLPIPSSVKVIGRAGAGVNNIPIDAMTQLGIPILNTPGANANAVREMVIAGMLLASRHLCQAFHYVRELKGEAHDIEKQVEQNKKKFVGFELAGKTLGIIGLGNVGVKVANAALHLGMQVIGFDPTITVNRAWELSAEVKQARTIDDLLIQSDFVSFHIPLNDETRHMINGARFQLMKNQVVLLNFARDHIIEHSALLEALNANKIYSYVTDFPHPHLKDHPRVISFPHLGASTKEAEENCAVMIVKAVREFLEERTITHSVNFPAIEMPKSKEAIRMAIVNENVPNMVAQVSAKLAAARLNIVSLLNKSRDNIAYTLIDVNQMVDTALLKDLSHIPGVIQVRKI